MPYPDRPHIAWPFGRSSNGTQINVVEQDSEAHVMSCEQVIARTPLGYRDDRPEFGWPWPDMRLMPIDPSGLIHALSIFEPRATPVPVETALNLVNAALGIEDIDIDVQIASGDSTGAQTEVD